MINKKITTLIQEIDNRKNWISLRFYGTDKEVIQKFPTEYDVIKRYIEVNSEELIKLRNQLQKYKVEQKMYVTKFGKKDKNLTSKIIKMIKDIAYLDGELSYLRDQIEKNEKKYKNETNWLTDMRRIYLTVPL